MTTELYWLTLSIILTGLIWVPYIVNRMAEMGILPAALNPEPDSRPKAEWAHRMTRAHANAIENLAIFAPLVIIVFLTESASELTAKATMVYFFARAVHLVVYTLGVPGVRTVAFVVGFICQAILALSILGLM